MPVVGYLGAISPGPNAHVMAVFRQALGEAGYVEGRNVAIEYRWAEGRYDRLPALAAELVRRQVTVLVATPTASAMAAKAATTTIPIVFSATDDPVKLGLVASLARPGGNATGVHFFLTELASKQLGLLRELVPSAGRIGLLINPDNANAETVTREVTTAASAIGVQIELAPASDSRGIEAAFAALVRAKAEALLVGADPFFYSRRLQLATLATRHAIPADLQCARVPGGRRPDELRHQPDGCLRQIGPYTARILKGAKPADLPVVQSTRFEFVINLPTARALGLDVPPTLLARADEVIE